MKEISDQQKETPKKKRRWAVFFLKCIGVLLLLFLLLIIAFQFESVQNAAADQVEGYLAKKWDRDVRLERIKIDWNSSILLEDFYLSDAERDTLIYVHSVESDLKSGLWSIWNQEIHVERLSVEGAKIKLVKGPDGIQIIPPGDQSDPKTEKKSSPWFIELNKLFFLDTDLTYVDRMSGDSISIYLDESLFFIDEIDFNRQIHLTRAELNNPNIQWFTDLPRLESEQKPIETNTSEPDIARDTAESNLALLIGRVALRNGVFKRTSTKVPIKKGGFNVDYDHLDAFQINGSLELVSIKDNEIIFDRPSLDFKMSTGFDLKELSATSIRVTDKQLDIEDIKLNTYGSSIKNDIRFKYKGFDAFQTFDQDVYLDVDLNNSQISLREIAHWVPALQNNAFYTRNRDSQIFLNGQVKGRLNNISLRNVDLALDNDIKLKGDIRVKGISDLDDAIINFKLDRLRTTTSSLRKRIPGLNVPNNFDRLGTLVFKGYFDGFLSDFVAEGTLQTDLGSTDLDMRLVTGQGGKATKYSGNVALNAFDLGVFTNNPDLGRVSGRAEVRNGVGLTPQNAQADVNAIIDAISFKGYDYDAIIFDGDIRNGKIDGYLNISDPNVEFVFDGTVDLNAETPLFDFKASIDTINFKELRLLDRSIQLRGDVEINATDLALNKFQGDVLLNDIAFSIDDSLHYAYDSILIRSTANGVRDKSFLLTSDVVDIDIKGAFLLDKIPASFSRLITSSYPEWSERLNIKNVRSDTSSTYAQDYEMSLRLHDSGSLTKIFTEQVDSVTNLDLNLSMNESDRIVIMDLTTPFLGIKDVSVHGLEMYIDKRGNTATLLLESDSIQVQSDMQATALNLNHIITRDTIYNNLSLGSLNDEIQDLNIGFNSYRLPQDRYGFTFNASELFILGEEWSVGSDNVLEIGKEYIHAENILFSNGNQFVRLNTFNDIGAELEAQNFDLEVVNALWDYDKLYFDGPLQLFVRADNIFELSNFEAEVRMDSLLINQDDFGPLRLVSKMEGVKNEVVSSLHIGNNHRFIKVDGSILPKGFNGNDSGKTIIDFNLDIDALPVNVAEYFIGDGIENTKGKAFITARVQGPTDYLDVDGGLRFDGAQTRVLYLGTTYDIIDRTLPITNELIDISGDALRDKFGNVARAEGGIRHDRLSNFRLGARLFSDKFLGLDTDRSDNEDYFGTALGNLDVRFEGPFDAPDIRIVAEPTTGTVLHIPLDTEASLSEDEFIVFTHDTITVSDQKDDDRFKIKGVNVEMDITVDPESEAQIIFNEETGDIMRGRGNGVFKVILNRNGDFNIFGDYVLADGDYLYTYEEFFLVNKKFEVIPGGRVTWTGDPFNARIDVNAFYTTATPLTNFVEGATDDVLEDLERAQRVKVIMVIDGFLENPQINFDLEFVNPSRGPSFNLVQNRLNTLRQDPNEMNRQVFGLLITGGFLPSGNTGGAVVSQETFVNTLSEFLSNQLSGFLTELFADQLTQFGLVSDFNLRFNYRENANRGLESGGNSRVVEFAPEFVLLEGKARLILNNYFVNSQNTDNNAYFANDVAIEFDLRDDGRLVARLFQTSDLELSNRKIEVGAGIRYVKNFDKLWWDEDPLLTVPDSLKAQ